MAKKAAKKSGKKIPAGHVTIRLLDIHRRHREDRVIPESERRWRMMVDGVTYDQCGVEDGIWSYAPHDDREPKKTGPGTPSDPGKK